MKLGTQIRALMGAVLFTMVAAGGAARAGTCESTCTDKHSQCTRNGGDYGVCMNGWRQCKTTCATPVKAAPAPAKATPAVVRR